MRPVVAFIFRMKQSHEARCCLEAFVIMWIDYLYLFHSKMGTVIA